jgi:hypothetical protein
MENFWQDRMGAQGCVAGREPGLRQCVVPAGTCAGGRKLRVAVTHGHMKAAFYHAFRNGAVVAA